jgi:exodeoxyribonuclease-3
MRLITWNCQGAFRKKADLILKLQPDILIYQECEHPDKLKFDSLINKPTDSFWNGDNLNKGIGVFSYSDYKFELMTEFNSEFRYVIPLKVSNNSNSFILLAIWAMNNKINREARYIGQIWLAINYYEKLLGDSTILIGDFNSNKIWDYKDRVGNHSDVVDKLNSQNINSVYHKHFKIEQGQEQHPTFFLQKKIFKPYHIDYCFASKDIQNRIRNVEIGKYEDWTQYSDHSPLIISFENF